MVKINSIKKYISPVFIAIWIPILIVMFWYIGTESEVLNNSVFPTPGKLFSTWKEMVFDGKYLKHVVASFSRVIKGFFIGSILGLALGIVIGLYDFANKSTIALIGMLRPIPAIALIPLMILSMGIGEESKVAVIALGSFWPTLINTISGLKSIDAKFIEVGKMFEKNKKQVLFSIIIPGATPYIFTGLRLGVSSSWTCVVAAEMIAASAGIGFLISYGREMAQPATLFIGIISMGIFGLLIELLMINIQKRALFWAPSNK
ncbi:sulfonate transport system permease protein [Pseudobutyrivibrio sp. YE44]|uniref:ABC transporter permease n=1 Tax=Pseudobutyrivibrio sp. YE44 TaxID=1520802 RepID=UPI000891425D|nr:ABC transporter permease [Pseudobutyrivibrio sp. YE44]SDB14745.1 sulfonate transport system permease protein [Pseudobutyrivibrio sp. YE44]